MKFYSYIFFLCCFFWSAIAMAEPLNVGVINLKPWGSVSKERQFVGQHIDFFNTLSQRTGLKFNYQILSIPTIKQGLKTGEIDMTVIFKRAEMARFVEFVGLVMPYNYYLVGKSGVRFDEEKARRVKRVGYIRGEEDVAHKCFTDKYNATAKMFPANDYGNLLKQLKHDRIEGAAIPSKGLKAYLSDFGENEQVISNLFILCENEAYLQTSFKSAVLTPDKIDLMRKELQKMREDGTIQRIADKYQELPN
ncbi:exported hypothetical protein [Candidatus Terasakiella magnetica]|uniref:Solute-binding protein family 3/N-terminal domain-containing protein n=1 Tax=Candidatus Terasakiella magnetica TaxID=1867952 RepID=A0A1C3RFE2_9PROT|nr:transporter substrate-binding domain-containing protein [Candidatus Terasakiella magnetica]SCA55971.1 exported hypothetical protein [Candidatus Terasakiella magnetica]